MARCAECRCSAVEQRQNRSDLPASFSDGVGALRCSYAESRNEVRRVTPSGNLAVSFFFCETTNDDANAAIQCSITVPPYIDFVYSKYEHEISDFFTWPPLKTIVPALLPKSVIIQL